MQPFIDLAEGLVQSEFVWAILCIAVGYVFYLRTIEETTRLRKQNDARENKLNKMYEDHRVEANNREERLKQEANAREEKLMSHLDKTTETLSQIERGLKEGITKLEDKMDGGFKEIWEQIGTITKEGAPK